MKEAQVRNKRVLIAALLALIAIAAFASLTMAQAPTAQITSPANGATVSGKVNIQGTANGPSFGYYKVEFKSATDWVLTDGVAEHKDAVTNGTLVTWDTTTVADGNYDLRLLVADVAGQYVTTQISVKVDNAAATAQAEAPRRGCLACHTQISPDGRYTLAWEAQNAVAAQGKTHPALPNGFKTTEQECLACHASNGAGDAGVAAPLSLRAIVHPAHEFSTTFTTEFKGNCFSCHDVDGTGAFTVIVDKMNVNAHGQPVSK
jgi:Bacterial Ig domain